MSPLKVRPPLTTATSVRTISSIDAISTGGLAVDGCSACGRCSADCEARQWKLNDRPVHPHGGVLDTARQQCAKVGSDVRLLQLDARRLADRDISQIHRHSRIDRGPKTADRDGLPEWLTPVVRRPRRERSHR